MKIVRIESHPAFKLEGNSRHFGSVWQLDLDRGESTPPHQRALEEIYCCLEGAGEMVVCEEKHQLSRGDVFFVPRLTNH